jgi:hypothetical protein
VLNTTQIKIKHKHPGNGCALDASVPGWAVNYDLKSKVCRDASSLPDVVPPLCLAVRGLGLWLKYGHIYRSKIYGRQTMVRHDEGWRLNTCACRRSANQNVSF